MFFKFSLFVCFFFTFFFFIFIFLLKKKRLKQTNKMYMHLTFISEPDTSNVGN